MLFAFLSPALSSAGSANSILFRIESSSSMKVLGLWHFFKISNSLLASTMASTIMYSMALATLWVYTRRCREARVWKIS